MLVIAMSTDERRERARARQQRVVLHKTRLGAEELDFSPIEGPEAISLLTRLSKESCQLAGLTEPPYERHQIPVRFVPT